MAASEIGFVGRGSYGFTNSTSIGKARSRDSLRYNLAVVDNATLKTSATNLRCVSSLREFVDTLPTPRITWVMIPAMEVSSCLECFSTLLAKGSIDWVEGIEIGPSKSRNYAQDWYVPYLFHILNY